MADDAALIPWLWKATQRECEILVARRGGVVDPRDLWSECYLAALRVMEAKHLTSETLAR